jgi:hypothetical protein
MLSQPSADPPYPTIISRFGESPQPVLLGHAPSFHDPSQGSRGNPSWRIIDSGSAPVEEPDFYYTQKRTPANHFHLIPTIFDAEMMPSHHRKGFRNDPEIRMLHVPILEFSAGCRTPSVPRPHSKSNGILHDKGDIVQRIFKIALQLWRINR